MIRDRTICLTVWAVTCAALALTVTPTVHTYYFDSPEFIIGAHSLGIVHAPGYPLYVMVAHLFTYLPLGDMAFRVNLLSAVSLSLTAPLLYMLLHPWLADRWVAAAAALMMVFTFHVWQTGISAEVYAPQLLTLVLTAWLLANDKLYWSGVSFGIALAMNPASVLFVPAFAAVLIKRRDGLGVVALACLCAVLPFLYFPARAGADLAYNAAGTFNGAGNFQAVNLRTVRGVWWLVSGAQFGGLFNWLPTWSGTREVILVLGGNVLWVGLAVAAVGLIAMLNERRRLLLVWLIAFVPFVYFYAAYGATDKNTMLGPGHVLLSVPIGFGLRAMLSDVPRWLKGGVLAVLVCGMFAVNVVALRMERNTSARDEAVFIMTHLPQDAVVFGQWGQVMPLQYLHIVEGTRHDVTLYNLFFFRDEAFTEFMQYTAWRQGDPIVLLQATGNSPSQNTLIDHFLELEPLMVDGQIIGYRVLGYRDAF